MIWIFKEIVLVSCQDEPSDFANLPPPCHVMPFEEDGTILLNIMESVGSDISQQTEPPQLPVSGEPGK